MSWGRNKLFLKPHRHIVNIAMCSYVPMWFKRIFYILLIFSGILYANDGDTFLQNAEYDKAISSYESQIKDGYLSHELFFNLGTAYQKSGNVPLAILNFEKALRLKPMDKTTVEQLTQLNLKLQDKPVIYEDTGLLAFFKKIQFGLSIDAWAFLSIFFMLLVPLVIFVSYKYRQVKFRKLLFSSSLLWFILSGFCVLMARNNYHYKYLHTEAIVTDESLIVYDASNTSSKIKFNVHQGTKLEVNDSTDTMFNIRFSEENGWVLRSGVKKIEL